MSRPEAVDVAIEAGYSVVPASLDKRPKVPWKAWQTEHQTADEVEQLGHGSLWGLVTGELYGLTVLDFDGEEGEQTMYALGLEPHVKTPGGFHVYVRHPGYPVKNAARKWEEYPGLDVRGDGGLAWFAGRSRKGKYEPLVWPPEPIDLDPELVEVFLPHPQETADRAARATFDGEGGGTPEAVRYLIRLGTDIRTAERGSSNAVLNKAAYSVGGLVAAGQLDFDYAFDNLLAAAEERGAGDPETVIGHAMATGQEAPWAFTPDEDDWIPAIAAKVFSSGGIPDPEPFPIDVWPSPLDELIRQGAKAVSAPPDYFGVSLLPVLGTAIGGYVDLQITETWRESAVIYGAMVGPPGARKTPPLKIVMGPVWDAERAMYEADRARAEEATEWHELDPPQIVVDDATIEALYVVLEKNPRGVLMRADELAGWVKGMGQYKGGAGRDRQTWLSIWSRDPLKVNRKTTSSHRIDKPFVSVLGGIQPEVLEEMIHAREDGLIPRILMARGEFVTPVLRRGQLDPGLLDRYHSLWNHLRDEGTIARTVQFTDAGYNAFEAWANEHYKSLGRVQGELAGAWAKMDAQAARICLILSRVTDTDVTPEIVDRAVSLVRYFQGQAAGLLRGTGSGSRWEKQNASRTKALGRFLRENPSAGRAEIMAEFEWALDARTLDRHLDSLADVGIWNGG